MQRSRGMLVLAVLVAAVAVSATAVGVLRRWQLPDPRTADRDGLLRWVATRDLSEESPAVRQVLALRLEEQFRDGIDWDAASSGMSPAQRECVWANVKVLLEPWLLAKVDEYFCLAASKRPAYVDGIIDGIDVWTGLEAVRPAGGTMGGSDATTEGVRDLLLESIEKTRQEAPPDDRRRIDEFRIALQNRWFLRALGDDSILSALGRGLKQVPALFAPAENHGE